MPTRRSTLPLLAGLLMVILGCDLDGTLRVQIGTLETSGLLIEVRVGPTQPVAREGVSNSAPLAGATVAISRASGPVVTTGVSDDSGVIRIRLAPGTYLLEAKPMSAATYPIAPAPQSVTVPPRRVAQVQLEYDSGIR